MLEAHLCGLTCQPQEASQEWGHICCSPECRCRAAPGTEGSQHTHLDGCPREAWSGDNGWAGGLAYRSSPGEDIRAGDSKCLVCQGSGLEAEEPFAELPARAATGSTTHAWQEAALVSPDSLQAVSPARRPQVPVMLGWSLTPASQTFWAAHLAPLASRGLLQTRQLDVQSSA